MNHSLPGLSEREPLYMRATGKLPYTLTNDYMFKALLQKNENVLKHLICALLHLRLEEIQSVKIRNPILLGAALTEDFDSKTFMLDINVLLNDQTLINLEMQVVDYKNWPERAVTYLCRNFDQLQSGQDYLTVKPTIHIGFLDFKLFPEYPEFYATYKMANVKNHHIFTDKIALSVVNLKYIELATQEDREWGIDYWATLFKATTWEELRMLAEQNPVMGDAVNTIYELTADESIREQCKAREKHFKEMNTVVKEREMAVQARDMAVKERDTVVKERDMAVQARDMAVEERNTVVKERDMAVQARDMAVEERNTAEREKASALQEKASALQEKASALQEKASALQEKEAAEREKEAAEREKEAAEREKEAAERERASALQAAAEALRQSEQKDQQIAALLQEIQRLKGAQE